jgi:cellulose synthase/poly-beta-1,6-N-acetylglucosamine synthase-like glycosyltransferase
VQQKFLLFSVQVQVNYYKLILESDVTNMERINELINELIYELGNFLVSNWLYVILTIVLTAFLMVVWYGCMIVFGVWDRLDEWFYPNNIINSLIGSIIYFVVLIFPIAVAVIIVDIVIM